MGTGYRGSSRLVTEAESAARAEISQKEEGPLVIEQNQAAPKAEPVA